MTDGVDIGIHLGHREAGKSAFDFVLSTEDEDACGDVLLASGWDLSRFAKNPIALYLHKHESPIGTWKNVRIEGGKLLGTLRLVRRGVSMYIDQIHDLLKEGVLRCCSVGFTPLEVEKRTASTGRSGKLIKRQRLIEVSLVPLPCNPETVRLALNKADLLLPRFETPGSVIGPGDLAFARAVIAARRATDKADLALAAGGSAKLPWHLQQRQLFEVMAQAQRWLSGHARGPLARASAAGSAADYQRRAERLQF